ncbi:MAG: c-type cytochrome [Pseudomonadota bacterium]
MIGNLLRAGVVLALMTSFNLAHAGDPVAGEAIYAKCSGCHGNEGLGNPQMNSPNIAGQKAWYIERQLENFSKAWRGTADGDSWGYMMIGISTLIPSAEERADVAAYIASMPVVDARETIEGDVKAGEAAYQVCVACHGVDGAGNEQLGSPRIAGQNDYYLLRQLHNYRNGRRAYASEDAYGATMRGIAMALPDDETLVNLVAYINTLPTP